MQQTLSLIRTSLEAVADPEHRDGMTSFFKEPINPLGVRSAEMKKVISSVQRRITGWDKDEVLDLCDALWSTGVFEEASIACKITAKLGKDLKEADFERLESWQDNHVTNWAHCDDLATHAVGSCIAAYPSLFARLGSWAVSENRWMRRGALVSLIFPLRSGDFVEDSFRLADVLMDDTDDLVQKGLGWMLKEGTHKHAAQVFQYVLANKDRMARIALRTAIEKLPDEMKKIAMAK